MKKQKKYSSIFPFRLGDIVDLKGYAISHDFRVVGRGFTQDESGITSYLTLSSRALIHYYIRINHFDYHKLSAHEATV
jgi:hypothetical protein